MNKKTLTKIAQKIIVIICIFMVLVTTTPKVVYADAGWDLGGALLKEFMQLLSFLGDMAMGLLNNLMLGADGVGSAMLSYDDENLSNSESWLYVDESQVKEFDEEFMDGEIDTKSFIDLGGEDFEIPNMLYSPENIFANNISALDINFLNPNTYQEISSSDEAKEKSKSSATILQPIIASWYKAFRNIAVVGLLSVLIYLGIRILISSTASDKAQYKERLKDWFVALCLIFFIHFIMSGLLMITDQANSLFAKNINEGYTIKAYDDSNNKTVVFRTNLVGLVRFQAQSYDAMAASAYTIIYIALVIYTFIFTFMYFKRFLYVAFFTMISPLVALTYPIDRAGDGKSQAFNMWFKEYTLNVIIQPVHLILYIVFVGSASQLARDNPIYALVAIAFLIPAEKFIKKMFGLDQASSTGDFGSFAGGALAMQGLNKLSGAFKGGAGKGSSNAIQGKAGENADGSNGNGRFKTLNTNALEAFTGTGGSGTGGSRTGGSGTGRSGTGRSGAGSNNQNNKDPDIQKGAARRLAIKGAKTLGKGVYKGAKIGTRVGFGAMGAAAGVAAGLTTGDASKVFQYGAAGAGVGYLAGKGISNLPEKAIDAAPGIKDKAFDKYQDIRQAANSALYGDDWAEQQRIKENNARERKKMLKDKNERQKYAKMAKELGINVDEKEDLNNFMNSAIDYKEQGVNDERILKNSLNFEKNNGGIGGDSHNKQMGAAKLAEEHNLTEADFTDSKKREQLENLISSKVSDKSTQQEILKHLGGTQGIDYKQQKRRQRRKK